MRRTTAGASDASTGRKRPAELDVRDAVAKRRMPTFSNGPNDDPYSFLKRLEFIMKEGAVDWDAREAIAFVGDHLDGNAGEWFFNLPPATRVDYDKLVAEFKRQFCNDALISLKAQKIFETRTQQPLETVAEFATELSKLANKVQPAISTHEQLRKFVNGVLPSIQLQLLLRNPTTMEDAVQHAQFIESALSGLAQRQTTPLIATVAAPEGVESGGTTLSSIAADMQQINRRLAMVERQLSDIKYHDPRHMVDKVDNNVKQCSHCGRPGHVAVDCFNNPQSERYRPSRARPDLRDSLLRRDAASSPTTQSVQFTTANSSAKPKNQ